MAKQPQFTSDTPVIELSVDNATRYLQDRALLKADARASVSMLAGGISNTVLLVRSDGQSFIVKQPLRELNVDDYWPFDRDRIFVERDCMQLLRRLPISGSVPAVMFHDSDNYVLVMSCAPPGGVVWKQQLMAGHVDLETAARAGRLLGDIHNLTMDDESVAVQFNDLTGFMQGRVLPYHRTVSSLYPELAPLIEHEVRRMLSSRRALVHGDFSPKNILTYPDHLFLFDFEVAHWGDPAFDTAFCLNHLVLKSIRFPERSHEYLTAARTMWQAYSHELRSGHAEVEIGTVRELGCLLLARIDGKSKVEYITATSTKQFARDLAAEILQGSELSIDATLDFVSGRVRQFEKGSR